MVLRGGEEPLARTKEFDPDLALRRSMDVFGLHGYEGTTMQLLLSGVGIARQSLYDTYGTKRELFLAAARAYISEKTAAVQAALGGAGSPRQAIEAVFAQVLDALNDERVRGKCFMVTSAIDYAPHDPELAAFMAEQMALTEQAFFLALERAQALGEIAGHHDLRALAQHLGHARNALTQAAKSSGDPQVLAHLARYTLAVLDLP
jgi:TetR/AcrR family transcriptional regulator, transcriptional repressor for nem operon